MGIRKNQSSLTPAERAAFVAAVKALKANGAYDGPPLSLPRDTRLATSMRSRASLGGQGDRLKETDSYSYSWSNCSSRTHAHQKVIALQSQRGLLTFDEADLDVSKLNHLGHLMQLTYMRSTYQYWKRL